MTDAEPLNALLRAVLPGVDFNAWWEAARATKSSVVGSGSLVWPADRAERVAMQFALCRATCSGAEDLDSVAMDFCFVSARFDDNIAGFSDRVLRPLARDIRRMAELRQTPPVLAEALAPVSPPTGDTILDSLMRSARDHFRARDPDSHRQALEKLWDAWERSNTIEAGHDKRASTARLLECASDSNTVRELLESEAKALTKIGNQFHIRHFETDKHPISDDRFVDYLFHRMWSFLWLLLGSRGVAVWGDADG